MNSSNTMKKIIFVVLALLGVAAARAQVVYSGPEAIQLSSGSYQISDWVRYQGASGAPFFLDFNGDGQADVELFYAPGPFAPVVGVGSVNGSAIVGITYATAGRFTRGQLVGADLPASFIGDWMNVNAPQVLSSPVFGGAFKGNEGFLGVQFLIGNQVHYGWVDVSTDATGKMGMINGWAFEQTAGAAIAAGDLGVLSSVPEPGTYGIYGSLFLVGLFAIKRRRAS